MVVLNSMTGFGSAEGMTDQVIVRVELKSVNHRFFDLSMTLPHAFSFLEGAIRACIHSHISRGAVTLQLNVEGAASSRTRVRTDWSVVDQYIESLRRIQQRSGADAAVFNTLPLLPGVYTLEEAVTNDVVQEKPLILKTVEEACAHLLTMRAAEGEHLQADLLKKTKRLKEELTRLHQLAPAVQTAHEARLREHIDRFLNHQAMLDEARLLNEVAVFADKSSIDEEVLRLDSHLQQMDDFLTLSGAEPVGRRLDFLIQEMNREINTIGAKGNDTAISQLVVRLKNELEKIREQIQNVE